MTDSTTGRSTPICVIGPGRAGTSVTMRVLNLLGVYIGPEEDLVEPGPGGPKGFWERRDMMKLDDRLLRLQGGSWRKPPPLPPGWEAAAELDPEREQARALIERVFARRELWGWKNPRVTLTTAFWLRLVPELRFVICLRNPIDVADSIAPPTDRKHEDAFYYSRRGPRPEQTYRLWLTYIASALANTAGHPRLLVSYDDYFEARRQTVERLARFVGVAPPQAGSELEHRIEDFVDRGLRHHRTPPAEVLGDGRLPRDVASLYMVAELLRAATEQPGEPGDAELAELEASVDRYARRLLAAGLDRRKGRAVDSPSLSG
ncbi:MAG TPA: sulfotransferase [Solirubrobacterales bacterium]